MFLQENQILQKHNFINISSLNWFKPDENQLLNSSDEIRIWEKELCSNKESCKNVKSSMLFLEFNMFFSILLKTEDIF